MAGEFGVTGAGVTGTTVPGPATGGAVTFCGMNSGPFWPHPDSANSIAAAQITVTGDDADMNFTIKIKV